MDLYVRYSDHPVARTLTADTGDHGPVNVDLDADPAIMLMMMLAMEGHLARPEQVREFIDGIQ